MEMCAVVVDDDDLRLLGLQRLRSRLRVALLSRTLYVRSLVVYYNDLRLHGLRDRLRCGTGLGLRVALSAVVAAALYVRAVIVYHDNLRLLLLHGLLCLRTRLLHGRHLLLHGLLHRHLPLRLRLIPLLLLTVTLLRLPVIRLSSRLLRVVGLRRSRLLPVCRSLLWLRLSAVALRLLSLRAIIGLLSHCGLTLLRESVWLSHAVLRLSHARLRGIRLRIVILLRRLLRAEVRL